MSTQRETRRAEILTAAKLEFCRKGLENASVSEIARRAGIGKSTIYEYFPSKDKLLEEVCIQVGDRIENELQQAFSQEDTLRGKILRYYQIVAGMIEELGIDYNIFFTSAPLKDIFCDYVIGFRARVLSKIREAVRQGQTSGEADPSLDVNLLAIVLTTQTNQLLFREIGEMCMENAIEQLTDIMMRGIRP